MLSHTSQRSLIRAQNRRILRSRLLRSVDMYLLLLPGLLLVLVFAYFPMYGIVIGFKDYSLFAGRTPLEAVFNSPWVGIKHWNVLWTQMDYRRALANTFIISAMKIAFGFPAPILLALMINEVRQRALKRVIQSTLYLPHFMSWVVVGALFQSILGTSGVVNHMIVSLGGTQQRFFMDNAWFRWVLLLTSMWKESGWSTIVYLAAITGIDPQLYEAARVDRANRWQQILHVTLPGIAPTIVMMFILRLGGMMDAGFSQILVMYNPTVYKSGDIIGTYVYRIGLGQLNFSQGTLVGLFNSVVNCILMLGGNMLSRKLTEKSIW